MDMDFSPKEMMNHDRMDGRDGRTRTCGLLLPEQALCATELHPVWHCCGLSYSPCVTRAPDLETRAFSGGVNPNTVYLGTWLNEWFLRPGVAGRSYPPSSITRSCSPTGPRP